MSTGFLGKLRSLIRGETPVTRVVQDPANSAEILLLTRLVLADGEAKAEEMAALRRICADAFGLYGKDFDDAISYLEEFGYETTGAQATAVFTELPEARRKALIGHLIAIAKADRAIDKHEVRLIARAGELLGVDPRELIRQHGA